MHKTIGRFVADDLETRAKLIDREAIIADAVNGEATKVIARRHGFTVKDLHEILDEHHPKC
jgi:hypothetical protein